ncbi:hypothetical protein Y032_0015g2848 [Ancylostoma ceylanicum]|uniref:Uncharacterized protein n=1 Tax=Ancylostoma ceylanicum TaxID=53326 RepID=A0A016V960_9BILA|nr:hypothetical protein Y032_0015g2848 [Ancylostoma ceylanicum]
MSAAAVIVLKGPHVHIKLRCDHAPAFHQLELPFHFGSNYYYKMGEVGVQFERYPVAVVLLFGCYLIAVRLLYEK